MTRGLVVFEVQIPSRKMFNIQTAKIKDSFNLCSQASHFNPYLNSLPFAEIGIVYRRLKIQINIGIRIFSGDPEFL